MKFLLILLTFLALLVLPLLASAGVGQLTQHTINVNGVSRTYWAMTPTNVVPGQPIPVIFANHGGGGNGNTFVIRARLVDYARANGFILIAPQGLDSSWRHSDAVDGNITPNAERDAGDDVAFFTALNSVVVPALGGNPTRLYCTGVSAGGMMCYRLACEAPGGMQLRALAVIASTMTVPPAKCPEAGGLSLYHTQGLADDRVPFNGGSGGSFSGVSYPPVLDGVNHVAAINLCSEDVKGPGPATGITRYKMVCGDGREVILDLVHNGGHEWNISTGLNEAAAVVGFFLSH